MRKLIIISLTFLLYISNSYSQISYKPNPETKKFAGYWQSISDTDTLILKLVNNEKVYFSEGLYTDVITGYITFIKKGKTVYQAEQLISMGVNNPTEAFNIFGSYHEREGANARLFLSFADHKDLNKLTMKLVPRGHLTPNKYPKPKIPLEWKLNRIYIK